MTDWKEANHYGPTAISELLDRQVTFVWINSAGSFKTNSLNFRNHIYYAHLYEYVRVNPTIGK